MSFVSAKYKVAKREWQGIDIEIYYDAKHQVNVEMMLDAVQRSLIYYTENFGPYMHNQCRIIEFPRYATFAQAFPGTMPYSESFGFVVNLEDEKENNMRIFLNLGHTFAHAYESCLGFSKKLNHGEAVIIGIKNSIEFSKKQSLINNKSYKFIKNHIKVTISSKMTILTLL